MQFVDSLPVGLEDAWWQIVTPPDDVERHLYAVIDGDELCLDLAITRDGKYQALIRVLPDTILGINRDGSRQSVYHIERAQAFFLDLDGEMTENCVPLRVVLSTRDNEVSAGFVVMWNEGMNLVATAS